MKGRIDGILMEHTEVTCYYCSYFSEHSRTYVSSTVELRKTNRGIYFIEDIKSNRPRRKSRRYDVVDACMSLQLWKAFAERNARIRPRAAASYRNAHPPPNKTETISTDSWRTLQRGLVMAGAITTAGHEHTDVEQRGLGRG